MTWSSFVFLVNLAAAVVSIGCAALTARECRRWIIRNRALFRARAVLSDGAPIRHVLRVASDNKRGDWR